MKAPRHAPSRPRLHLAAGLALALAAAAPLVTVAQVDDPPPPDHVVRLIFIHHSCGENWLADGNGGLGLALGRSNYFVSDTNYGWGPGSIGDRTDIPDWLEWFRGEESHRYLEALYSEDGQNSAYTRSLANPGGENEIILFKSCFPNSNLEGQPDDPPASSAGYSVGGARYVYNQLLEYFRTRPEKLFIVITAPPVRDPTCAANARALNDWLVNDWLRQNEYPYANVAVFDFYNILTGPDHHHTVVDGEIVHSYQPGHDTAAYPTDDDHPSREGNRRATEEFVPLLNYYYQQWRADAATAPSAPTSVPAAAEPSLGVCPGAVALVALIPAGFIFRQRTRWPGGGLRRSEEDCPPRASRRSSSPNLNPSRGLNDEPVLCSRGPQAGAGEGSESR